MSAPISFDRTVLGALEKDAPVRADTVLSMLASLDGIRRGLPVDQLTHALQCASYAEREGSDVDVIVGALCHDIAKVISSANHPAIAAELLRPVVRHDVYLMVKYHQVSLAGPIAELEAAGAAAVALAQHFTDQWDRYAFDTVNPAPPLAHFEPMVRTVFGREVSGSADR